MLSRFLSRMALKVYNKWKHRIDQWDDNSFGWAGTVRLGQWPLLIIHLCHHKSYRFVQSDRKIGLFYTKQINVQCDLWESAERTRKYRIDKESLSSWNYTKLRSADQKYKQRSCFKSSVRSQMVIGYVGSSRPNCMPIECNAFWFSCPFRQNNKQTKKSTPFMISQA